LEATKAILQKTQIVETNKELQNMLTDWFELMNYEKWNTKWKVDENIIVQKLWKSMKQGIMKQG
jgi:hypothetical protein